MAITLKLGTQGVSTTVVERYITTSEYVRPSDWLSYPITGSQEFAGLAAVYNTDSNFIALSCAGDYWVDWGNGYSASYVANTTAEYSHSYNSLPSSSYCSRGYRQAWIRVTPSGSANLTTINLQKKPSRTGLTANYSPNWLDIAVNAPSASTITIGGSTVLQKMLENVNINKHNLTSCYYMFQNCAGLQNINSFNTSNIADFSGMFQYCYSLKTIPLLDTSNGTNFTNMFYGCNSFSNLPLLDTSKVQDFSAMFAFCSALTTIPLINSISATNWYVTFAYCYALQYLPPLNMVNTTSWYQMLYDCVNLRSAAFSGSKNNSISYAGCCLSRDAIVDIFNGLGTAAGVYSITVTGNHGVPDLTAGDLQIATDKGWTVVTA